MPIGRQCVDHYRQLSRYCVFSHDEMVCNMAAKADHMEVELASAVQKEMAVMIQEEEELRGKVNAMVSRHPRGVGGVLAVGAWDGLTCRSMGRSHL
jgi:hypothetical protein